MTISIMLKMYRTSFSGILKDSEVFVGSVHAFANTDFLGVIDVLLEIARYAFVYADCWEILEEVELFVQCGVGYELRVLLVLAAKHI